MKYLIVNLMLIRYGLRLSAKWLENDQHLADLWTRIKWDRFWTLRIRGRRGSAFHDPTRPTRCWTQPTPRINPTHDRTWRRPPGRPRNNWLDQVRNDSTLRPTGELWRRAVDRGHGGATTPLLV